MNEDDDRYRPISPLGYIGFQILYAIPGIGLLAVIIIAIVARNKNVKNFAVAQLIAIILAMIVIIVLSVVAVLNGMTPEQIMDAYNSQSV